MCESKSLKQALQMGVGFKAVGYVPRSSYFVCFLLLHETLYTPICFGFRFMVRAVA